MTDVAPEPGLPSDADTTVPHSARIWNYWLGGRLNYPVDRAAGEAYQQVYPQIVDVALASRGFQSRTRASRGPRTSPTSAASAGRPDRSWLPSIGGRPAPVRKR